MPLMQSALHWVERQKKREKIGEMEGGSSAFSTLLDYRDFWAQEPYLVYLGIFHLEP